MARGAQRAGVTLADVARLVGLSEITISRVLRNKGPISADTRLRVMQAVGESGYLPNRIAGTLASAGSSLIGVVLPSLSNTVFPEVLEGINAAMASSGFQPVIAVTNYDIEVEQALVVSLLAWQPAAMIIAGTDHTEITRRHLAQSGVRVAELMEIDTDPIDLAVGFSNRDAGYATGRHLIARGYKRFGYVGHDWDADRRAKLRFDGLRRALAEASLPAPIAQRHAGPSSTSAGSATLAALLAEAPDRDVVVFSNDDMAVGGVFHCMANGIAIRTQLALFGFNGLDIGQALPTPLSTLRSNRHLIGQTAVQKLLASRTRLEASETIDTGFEIIAGATA
jgi:LacI family gluconate utilization system Gnt-I transcriptional repressor